MPRVPTEFEIQRALCLWLDRPGVLVPGVVYWHTPNGGSRRDAFEGKRLKQIGLKAGVHDLLFLWGGLYGLEMKAPDGTRSEAQIDMHGKMLAAGMVASATVDDLQDARRHLFAWNLVTTC